MKKIISYSLWGDNNIYLKGVLKNYERINTVLVDYKMRIYVDSSYNKKEVLYSISNLEIIEVKSLGDYHGMYWRFFAFEDCDVVLSRDLDSRITDREIEIIRKWEDSKFSFFVIKDHILHKMPIMGGMWGGRNGLKNIKDLIKTYGEFSSYGDDQKFLKQHIFPIIENDCIEFSSNNNFFFKNRFLFEKSKTGEFIGERINEDETPLYKTDRLINQFNRHFVNLSI